MNYSPGISRLLRLTATALCFSAASAAAQFSIDIEGGLAVPLHNDIRVPRDGGDDISFTSDLKSRPAVAARARLSYTLGERHTLSALFAPLQVGASGTLSRDVKFNGVTFHAGVPLEGEYTFNNYRLTYRYAVVHDSAFTLGVGLSGNVRDAAITLATPLDTLPSEQRRASTKNDLGFIPLLNLNVVWRVVEGGGLLLDADAMIGPLGRAEDAQFAVWYDVTPTARLRLGYRILEGGADVEEVYNVALVNYAMLGVTVRLE